MPTPYADVENFTNFGAELAQTGGQDGVHKLQSQNTLPVRFIRESVQKMTDGPAGPVPVLNDGKPIFEDEIHVHIYMPGGDITSRRMEPTDKMKFPQEWAAFEAGDAPVVSGTPLKEWTEMTPAALSTLNVHGIFTIEGLADMPDAACEKIGGIAFMFKERAVAYLERAKGQNAELDAMREQNAFMAEQLKVMQEQIATMNAPKRRGRPPKGKPNDTGHDDSGGDGSAEPSAA